MEEEEEKSAQKRGPFSFKQAALETPAILGSIGGGRRRPSHCATAAGPIPTRKDSERERRRARRGFDRVARPLGAAGGGRRGVGGGVEARGRRNSCSSLGALGSPGPGFTLPRRRLPGPVLQHTPRSRRARARLRWGPARGRTRSARGRTLRSPLSQLSRGEAGIFSHPCSSAVNLNHGHRHWFWRPSRRRLRRLSFAVPREHGSARNTSWGICVLAAASAQWRQRWWLLCCIAPALTRCGASDAWSRRVLTANWVWA